MHPSSARSTSTPSRVDKSETEAGARCMVGMSPNNGTNANCGAEMRCVVVSNVILEDMGWRQLRGSPPRLVTVKNESNRQLGILLNVTCVTKLYLNSQVDNTPPAKCLAHFHRICSIIPLPASKGGLEALPYNLRRVQIMLTAHVEPLLRFFGWGISVGL